jgi:YjjG family noncanonical pyrimidine nucleotidase
LLTDADNTLFDFPAGERLALTRALGAFGIPADPPTLAAYHRINDGLWRKLERGEIATEVLRVRRFELLLGELGRPGGAAALANRFADILGEYALPLPGAEAAVARWAARVPVAIVTNGIAAIQRARLKHSPIRGLIRALVISGEVGVAKPDPHMVHVALDALGCREPADALLLGDSLEADIAAAANAGIASCWYNPAGAANLSPFQPTYTVASLDEVDALLP